MAFIQQAVEFFDLCGLGETALQTGTGAGER
jgi:hypothetical protein